MVDPGERWEIARTGVGSAADAIVTPPGSCPPLWGVTDMVTETCLSCRERISVTICSVSIAPVLTAKISAHERIMVAAYGLFSRRGIRNVSVDEVIALSGVAKATLYRHFPSKDDLVLAFLARREREWTYGLVAAGAIERSADPVGRLLAVFDVFHDWFQRDDFEACSFVNVLLELGPDHPAGRASIGYLANVRSLIARFAEAAGLREPEEFARSWHILMKGSIVQAAQGDLRAAQRSKGMGELLIAQHSVAQHSVAQHGA